jgi:hypothetical protein
VTSNEARRVFNAALAGITDPDRRAKIEVAREYFCNPAFRAALKQFLVAQKMPRI